MAGGRCRDGRIGPLTHGLDKSSPLCMAESLHARKGLAPRVGGCVRQSCSHTPGWAGLSRNAVTSWECPGLKWPLCPPPEVTRSCRSAFGEAGVLAHLRRAEAPGPVEPRGRWVAPGQAGPSGPRFQLWATCDPTLIKPEPNVSSGQRGHSW